MNSPPPLPAPFDPNKNSQPVWRQAFQWLDECHVLSPEAKRILSLPTSTIGDLAEVLADGSFGLKRKRKSSFANRGDF